MGYLRRLTSCIPLQIDINVQVLMRKLVAHQRQGRFGKAQLKMDHSSFTSIPGAAAEGPIYDGGGDGTIREAWINTNPRDSDEHERDRRTRDNSVHVVTNILDPARTFYTLVSS